MTSTSPATDGPSPTTARSSSGCARRPTSPCTGRSTTAARPPHAVVVERLGPVWTWAVEPGSPVPVDVYATPTRSSSCSTARSLGVAPRRGARGLPRPASRPTTARRPRRGGVPHGRRSRARHIAHRGRRPPLAVSADRSRLPADDYDLAFVAITLETRSDRAGAMSTGVVTVTVEGPAMLAGLGHRPSPDRGVVRRADGHHVRRSRAGDRATDRTGRDHRDGPGSRTRAGGGPPRRPSLTLHFSQRPPRPPGSREPTDLSVPNCVVSGGLGGFEAGGGAGAGPGPAQPGTERLRYDVGLIRWNARKRCEK